MSLNRHAPDACDIRDISSPSPEQWKSRSLVQSNPKRQPPDTLGIDLKGLMEMWFNTPEEKLQQTDAIVTFISWIAGADFLRLQQPEPTLGQPTADYPGTVDILGIRGQSVYTALFHHEDMETFTCRICHYVVEFNLEDAITHQRKAHFNHYPYQCTPNHTPWYVSFALSEYV